MAASPKTAVTPLAARRRVLAVVLGLGAWLSGCATAPPSQEMSDARQALRAAAAAGAGELLADDMGRARGFLEGAEQAMALDEYERARSSALAAKRTALWAHKVAASIRTAEEVVSAARTAGHALRAAETELASARAAARTGESTKALEHAERARRLGQAALSGS